MTRQLVRDRIQPKGQPGAQPSYGGLKGVGSAATGYCDRTRTWSHAGMLYRWKKEVRLFEMKTHKVLGNDPARPNFVWIEPRIPPERMRVVAAKARLVFDLHQKSAVPYGFGYDRTTFDENGGLRLGAGEMGLTCSTIVAAILESERLPLLDPRTWPPPDQSDIAVRREFIRTLRAKDPEHAKTLEGDIQTPRISPEEVVAAAATFPQIGTFDNLQAGAAEVAARIVSTATPMPQ
jgi:hypothetical protein